MPSADATTASGASGVVVAGAADVVVAGAADVVAAGAAELSLSEPQPDATKAVTARTSVRMKQLLFSMKTFPPTDKSK